MSFGNFAARAFCSPSAWSIDLSIIDVEADSTMLNSERSVRKFTFSEIMELTNAVARIIRQINGCISFCTQKDRLNLVVTIAVIVKCYHHSID